MNRYIKLNRIEFVITDACSGKCKHCSNGERSGNDGVDADAAVNAVKRLAERFAIESLMTFGGEPLLFADTVYKIHAAACDCSIPKRDLITNGFFTKDERRINEVAQTLVTSGVNDIGISVDVFHQEYIPLEPVMIFAEALLKYEIPSLSVQPAWVVNENAENPYNAETKRLLKLFNDKGIQTNEGNNIFPSGNALKHLGEYFTTPGNVDLSLPCGSMPYTERLDEVSSFGINPNGDVNLCSITIGNIYKTDVLDIVDRYDPYSIPAWQAMLNGGVPELLRYAESQNLDVDISDCRSACGVCRKIMTALKNKA
ncbi:MAG: radical SAM protein [Lachnospiraceae bacterium]|jgi:MoaA/NifB/PqqE/SkfB family radical SAM enzyme|nr:radical SAM protein [Lachnospiraceae bacterium]